MLPSSANQHTWGHSEDPSCKLCGRRGSLEHVLSSCQTALTEGRYRWRCNQVLADLANKLDQKRKKKRNKNKVTIQFVKQGQAVCNIQKNEVRGILSSAEDWEMLVDLKRQLRFPPETVDTIKASSRHHSCVKKNQTRGNAGANSSLGGVDKASLCKKEKESTNIWWKEYQEKGWKASCHPAKVHVGCRGFAG